MRITSDGNRPEDFDVAEIARQELQNVVEKFRKESGLTWRQRLGITNKSAKTKAIDILEKLDETDFNQLKDAVDELEDSWKQNNGSVSRAESEPSDVH